MPTLRLLDLQRGGNLGVHGGRISLYVLGQKEHMFSKLATYESAVAVERQRKN